MTKRFTNGLLIAEFADGWVLSKNKLFMNPYNIRGAHYGYFGFVRYLRVRVANAERGIHNNGVVSNPTWEKRMVISSCLNKAFTI